MAIYVLKGLLMMISWLSKTQSVLWLLGVVGLMNKSRRLTILVLTILYKCWLRICIVGGFLLLN